MWKILFNVGSILLVLHLTSCHINQNEPPKKIKVFKYNESTGISSTDPAYAKDQSNIWCVNHLYNGLVQLDEHLNIKPCLAKNWLISSDGLTYTFNLNNDVYFIEDKCFNNKRKLISSDIVYTFYRLLDPKIASPGAWIFRNKVDTLTPFLALNDSTFQLKLSRPFPPMLSILSMQYTFIVPKEAVEMYAKQFSYHPVGTGPFKLKNWEEGNALYLEKNMNYFEKEGTQKLPYLDAIKISFIENKKTEFLEFLKGNLSFITDISISSSSEIIDEKGLLTSNYRNSFQLNKCPYLKTEYIGFNLLNAQPIDKRIRYALNICFDRAKMIHYLRNNIGRVAQAGMIPYGLPAYDTTMVKGYSYQFEKAKKIISDLRREQTINPITLYTNENYKEYALYIANEAKKIDLIVKVEVVPPVLLREWMTQGKVSCFRASWIADYPEAESYMSLFYSKNNAPPNYTRFSNKDFDDLYEKSLLENNSQIRNEMYHQMENIIIHESPVIPIFYDEVIRLTQKNIQNLKPNAMNLLDLKRTKID